MVNPNGHIVLNRPAFLGGATQWFSLVTLWMIVSYGRVFAPLPCNWAILPKTIRFMEEPFKEVLLAEL